MVRPIEEEEAMAALSGAMRILKEVGEQVNGQLLADHASCLRCMIWGRQSVSVLKLMVLSALSCEDCKITEGTLCRPSWGTLPGCTSDPHRWQTSTRILSEPQFGDKFPGH